MLKPAAAALSLVLCAIAAGAPADAAETSTGSQSPIIYDAMNFVAKPDLGLSRDVAFIYEWEATQAGEQRRLQAAGSREKASALTIEPGDFSEAVALRSSFKYIAIDIETLDVSHIDIALRYMELAKAAAPHAKVSWWNSGPRDVVDSLRRPFNREKWLSDFQQWAKLIRANDYFILGAYFLSRDTLQSWGDRNLPRVAEAQRQFPGKPILVTISPHGFDAGRPWQFVSGDLFGGAMDKLAAAGVDGIVLWSFEGTGQIQKWNGDRAWVQALQARTGTGARYKHPGH